MNNVLRYPPVTLGGGLILVAWLVSIFFSHAFIALSNTIQGAQVVSIFSVISWCVYAIIGLLSLFSLFKCKKIFNWLFILITFICLTDVTIIPALELPRVMNIYLLCGMVFFSIYLFISKRAKQTLIYPIIIENSLKESLKNTFHFKRTFCAPLSLQGLLIIIFIRTVYVCVLSMNLLIAYFEVSISENTTLYYIIDILLLVTFILSILSFPLFFRQRIMFLYTYILTEALWVLFCVILNAYNIMGHIVIWSIIEAIWGVSFIFYISFSQRVKNTFVFSNRKNSAISS